MKKMYFLAVLSILATTLLFLFFHTDENTLCIKYLESRGYRIDATCSDSEIYQIPQEFDEALLSYNLIQLSQGFDLTSYKGKNAVKHTYKITNCPEISRVLYANFITVNGKIVSADLVNPQIDGFILPLVHISDLIKYHSPATNDAVMP